MIRARLASRLGIGRYRADEHYRAGCAAFVSRDIQAAIDQLRQAADLLPGHAEYHAALGFVLLNDQRRDEAKTAFERALSLNPLDMLANYGQGMIAYRDKQWRAALARFEAALAAQPKRAETQYYLAMAQHRLGRNDLALGWMREAAASFANADDRRQSQCQAWISQFQKLIEPA